MDNADSSFCKEPCHYWLIILGVFCFVRAPMTKFIFKTAGPLIKHLEKRGIFVVFWVLNDREEFEKAIEVAFILLVRILNFDI